MIGEKNEKMTYCDKCREKLLDKIEVYKIVFNKPSANLASSFFSKQDGFSVCRKCYIVVYDLVEKTIIGGRLT